MTNLEIASKSLHAIADWMVNAHSDYTIKQLDILFTDVKKYYNLYLLEKKGIKVSKEQD